MHVSVINSINFCRKLTEREKTDYRNNAIKPALEYLGVSEVAMILHGTSYPQDEYDMGVGSPYGKVAAQLIPFELLHGFNSNQLGPVGELNSVSKISPYESSVGAKNYLFIDMHKLSTPEYANILDERLINNVFKRVKSDKIYAYSDFPEAFENYKFLIRHAYKNYKKQLIGAEFNNNPDILKLQSEYQDFLNKKPDLENYAIFAILAKKYGTTDFRYWDDIDKNLVNGLRAGDENSIERYKKIKLRSGNDIEIYCFAQFLIDKQIKENTQFRQNAGFKYISDMLAGFSPADEWSHQDLFLKNYALGCPYGGPDGGIQRWNIPVLNPKKLFNKDGSLAPAGEYLKAKLEDALENFDNVRVDHALGLVDPYIYEKKGYRAGNVSIMPDIDPDKNYQKVLNGIILPTLEEHGIDKNTPVWEDLVTDTPDFNRIYYGQNNLPGITQLEYKKAEQNANPNNWTLIGSHDSDPALKMIKKDWVRANEAWNPMYLAGVLNAAHDSRKYCEKIDHDDSERIKAKFAELFMMGNKIQISFADFFGIDKTYNEGGNDKNPDNWKLRLSSDYEDMYYKNLSSSKPTAINMPEILKLAVNGKADMDIARYRKNPDEVYAQSEPIIQKLEEYEKILKE